MARPRLQITKELVVGPTPPLLVLVTNFKNYNNLQKKTAENYKKKLRNIKKNAKTITKIPHTGYKASLDHCAVTTFPQGFKNPKNFGHSTSGSGGKKMLKRYLKSEHTDKQTDKQTYRHFDL